MTDVVLRTLPTEVARILNGRALTATQTIWTISTPNTGRPIDAEEDHLFAS